VVELVEIPVAVPADPEEDHPSQQTVTKVSDIDDHVTACVS